MAVLEKRMVKPGMSLERSSVHFFKKKKMQSNSDLRAAPFGETFDVWGHEAIEDTV